MEATQHLKLYLQVTQPHQAWWCEPQQLASNHHSTAVAAARLGIVAVPKRVCSPRMDSFVRWAPAQQQDVDRLWQLCMCYTIRRVHWFVRADISIMMLMLALDG
jgi:hypothetical protein